MGLPFFNSILPAGEEDNSAIIFTKDFRSPKAAAETERNPFRPDLSPIEWSPPPRPAETSAAQELELVIQKHKKSKSIFDATLSKVGLPLVQTSFRLKDIKEEKAV